MSEPTSTQAAAPAAAVAAAPTGVTLSDDQFQQLLSRLAPAPALVGAAAEAAPAVAAPVAEAAPAPVAPTAVASAPVAEAAPVTETEDQRIARIVEAQVQARVTQVIQENVAKAGPPARKGLVGRVLESGEIATVGTAGELNSHGMPADWPDKPLHEFNSDERAKYFSTALLQHVTGARG